MGIPRTHCQRYPSPKYDSPGSSERLCLKKTEVASPPEEQHPKLTSGLHMHVHTHAHTHTCSRGNKSAQFCPRCYHLMLYSEPTYSLPPEYGQDACPCTLHICFFRSLRCQNWEGGIGGVPGMEAHGGYTFCGLAALVILKKERSLNLKSLLVS